MPLLSCFTRRGGGSTHRHGGIMKILLAVPTSRYIENECYVSLYGMTKRGKVDIIVPGGYSVDVTRNNIAKYALENKYDYIMWVDSDIIVPKDTLVKLLSHNKDIVSGVYAYKTLGAKQVVAKRFDSEGEYEDLTISEIRESKKLIKVDGVGFGCVLTKTEIFDKINYPWFVFTQESGEDIYLCRKAQNAGYEIYLDPTVLCGHIGTVNYNIKEG